MTYLTAQGFKKPTFSEVRAQIEAFVLSLPAYGPGTDLSAEGPLGQLIATQTLWASALADGAQEFYTSRDLDQATGVALDEILGELGCKRFPASPAMAYGVLLWGTPAMSFAVPTGSQIKASAIPAAVMLLQGDVVFATGLAGPFRGAALRVPGTLVVGNVLSVTLSGATYAHTVTTAGGKTQTKQQAIAALAATINSGVFSSVGSAAYRAINGSDHLVVLGTDFALNAFSANFALSQVAQAGSFEAANVGELAIPAGSLDTVLSPITGWLGVEQPAEAVAGTYVETDTAYRIRGRKRERSGTGTDEAIESAVASVLGVSAATCTSNRTNSVDIDGRTANSFEVLVSGGEDGMIADAIARTMPSGIAPFGLAHPAPISGRTPSGRAYLVNFSRPVPTYAWLSVIIISHDPDGGLPADYAAAVQDSVVAYGKERFGLGADYILQKMYAAIYAVPGIYSVTIQIATTPTVGGSPVYGSANIPVDARHFLVFDQSRVAVSG